VSDLADSIRLDTSGARVRLGIELDSMGHTLSVLTGLLTDGAYSSMPSRLSEIAAAASRAAVEAGALTALESLRETVNEHDRTEAP